MRRKTCDVYGTSHSISFNFNSSVYSLFQNNLHWIFIEKCKCSLFPPIPLTINQLNIKGKFIRISYVREVNDLVKSVFTDVINSKVQANILWNSVAAHTQLGHCTPPLLSAHGCTQPLAQKRAAPGGGRFTFNFKVANHFINLKLLKPRNESLRSTLAFYSQHTHTHINLK